MGVVGGLVGALFNGAYQYNNMSLPHDIALCLVFINGAEQFDKAAFKERYMLICHDV